MTWRLPDPINSVGLTIEPDGLWLRMVGGDISDLKALRDRKANNRLGRLLPSLIPQLIELGLAVYEDGALRIPHRQFVQLEGREIDAFGDLVPRSPFTIEIESSGALGMEDFQYRYRFYYGRQPVYPERLGAFVRRGAAIYQLDEQTFALIEAIERFNSTPPRSKWEADAYIRFAEIKGLAEGVGAEIDEYIGRQRVLAPPQIGLDIIDEGAGRVSFAPRVDGAPPKAMWRAFIGRNGVDEVYSLDHGAGGNVYVVLNETQRELLRRMQRARHLGGVEKTELLRNPHSLFDGLSEAIDLSDFGPRVKGIGDFPFVAQPYYKAGTGIFDDIELRHPERDKDFSAGIQCRYADGSVEDVEFDSREEILDFHRRAQQAYSDGKGVIEFHGKSILVDSRFVNALDELVEQISSKGGGKGKDEKQRRYLLIYNNDESIEHVEKDDLPHLMPDLMPRPELPKSLNPDVRLKPHQEEGVAWLQRNYLLGGSGRRGCLLADDMGCGKTFQVLTFLAWLIERGDIAENSNPELPPWKPILIVAPLILIENETWIQDMKRFFSGDGAIFLPYLILRDKALKELRNAEGKEIELGRPTMDLDRLRQYRIVLTNYETVVNYQYSFARMRDRWSVVVTDEAQEYKTTNTKISHALKSLDPRFRIACTGTPVETRLGDIWNIFDFLQPGSLLGAATEFRREYEAKIQEPADAGAALKRLKTRLRFGRPDAFLLRREKRASLPGLPNKREHRIECLLSPEQRQAHLDLIGRARGGGKESHPFSVISRLQKLYQHPALLPRYEGISAEEALKRCPKLRAVIECLREIRSRREKALIFTRTLDMQQMLVSVLNEVFRLDVDVINGETRRAAGENQGAKRARQEVLRRFRESDGFNALILSPDVAGIGLTIVEANHVIHYGRWWNPAKESQATDRVYRIGQERDVHVYHPVAKDPQGEFETFDEKLDQLIRRRVRLAEDFLAPMPPEEEIGRELFDSLLSGAESSSLPSAHEPLSIEEVRRLTDYDFEAFVAAIERRSGKSVILTPQSGDGGVDVISIAGRELRLIQCKRAQWGGAVDVDAVEDLVTAFDGYRAKHLRSFDHHVIRPALVTNGSFTRAAEKLAKERGVETIDQSGLLKTLQNTPVTMWDVEEVKNDRCISMRDLQDAISNRL